MEQSENFSDDLQENLRIENEFLKIKLKAQYGDAFEMENSGNMPPEIENQFLKSMMTFEEEYTNAEYVTVFERIGQPVCKPVSEMSPAELNTALKKLIQLLIKNDISLDIVDGPYPDDLIYRFITEEFFTIKVEKKAVPGITWNFVYEEFHPNHEADIIKRAHAFLNNWFNRRFNEYCTELSWHCVTEDGMQLTREDIVAKMDVFFKAFHQFKNDGYNIDNTSFELLEDGEKGMGFAEGTLQYDAILDNGETIQYKGPYKLYMQREDSWWSIFYFVMPGFKW